MCRRVIPFLCSFLPFEIGLTTWPKLAPNSRPNWQYLPRPLSSRGYSCTTLRPALQVTLKTTCTVLNIAFNSSLKFPHILPDNFMALSHCLLFFCFVFCCCFVVLGRQVFYKLSYSCNPNTEGFVCVCVVLLFVF